MILESIYFHHDSYSYYLHYHQMQFIQISLISGYQSNPSISISFIVLIAIIRFMWISELEYIQIYHSYITSQSSTLFTHQNSPHFKQQLHLDILLPSSNPLLNYIHRRVMYKCETLNTTHSANQTTYSSYSIS